MRPLLPLALLAALTACSGEKAQEALPTGHDEVAAMAGRAARQVMAADHTDTLALQQAIVAARAECDAYRLTGEPDCADVYQQAFIDSLRQCDPAVAREVFP